MNPKISIIIPVFNGSNYLNQAIDSALGQDYDNFEVIVVNDGSMDNLATEKIALSYGNTINYFYQENKGVASAWNKGVELSSGEYISFLSHDDLYTKDKISVQIKKLQSQEDKNCIIYSNWVIIDENNQEKDNIILPNLDQTKFYLYYLLHQSLHGCTLLIPKHLFVTEGNFDENLKSTCDYDFILRLALKCNYILCPEILVKGRKHSDQYTYKIPSHTVETELFFIKFIKLIDNEMLNRAFSLNDQQKYLFNLFVNVLRRGYSNAALILLRQLYILYQKDPNIAMKLIYTFVQEMSKLIK
jgi:glycosyltransferase involved in cell wall biosynthesis